MHRFWVFLLPAAFAVSGLSGCASLMHGGDQTIRLSSSPTDAVVKVNGYPRTRTPAKLELERDKLFILQFEKEGYPPVQIPLENKLDSWLAGNIILTGAAPLGLVIDFATGAAYQLTPVQIEQLYDGDEPGPGAKIELDLEPRKIHVIWYDAEELQPEVPEQGDL